MSEAYKFLHESNLIWMSLKYGSEEKNESSCIDVHVLIFHCR